MRKIILALIVLVIALPAQAALAPEYQNPKDLEVMVRFIKGHPRVLSSLQSIDFENYTVNFAPHCKAEFGRKNIFRLWGRPGPAPPLEFKESNCDVNEW